MGRLLMVAATLAGGALWQPARIHNRAAAISCLLQCIEPLIVALCAAGHRPAPLASLFWDLRHSGFMRFFRTTAALAVYLLVLAAAPPAHAAADTGPPGSEVLSYTAEWRFIHAGNARLTWSPSGDGFTARLHLESAGMVSSIYKVDDSYASQLDRELCAVSLSLEANEGSRRHDT